MKKKIKVLQVIPRLGYGGAETGCYDLAHFLPEQGYKSYIATSGGELLKFINKKININNLEDKVGFKISKDQKIIEYSPLSHKYLKDISKNLISKNGALLIIDYGYLDVLMSNTLQSIKKHKKTPFNPNKIKINSLLYISDSGIKSMLNLLRVE
mgnify:CR=1 FL=1